MTYREAWKKGEEILTAAGIAEECGLDARLLLEHVCGTNRNDLLAHGDRQLSDEERKRYEELLARRAERIPLQHLTGEQDFMGLTFAVNENVLIPRQDTEILAEEVLRNLHDGMRILDMCTGSGCILISLLHYSNNCTGVGADISGEALETARKNGLALLKRGEDILPGECEEPECVFLQSDLFENVEGVFDIIVSNPPYIPSGEIETLMPEVRDREPRRALDGAGDGLFFYRRILEEGMGHLTRGGMLFFEIGCDQAGMVSALMEQAGFLDITVVQDYAGLDRVVYGTRSFARHGGLRCLTD